MNTPVSILSVGMANLSRQTTQLGSYCSAAKIVEIAHSRGNVNHSAKTTVHGPITASFYALNEKDYSFPGGRIVETIDVAKSLLRDIRNRFSRA